MTKYLKSLNATFNPLSFQKSHQIPRIVLSFLKPDARSASAGGMTVTTNVLPAKSKEPSSLMMSFKDGKELKWVEKSEQEGVWDLKSVNIKDVTEEVNRHSRILRRKEELSG